MKRNFTKGAIAALVAIGTIGPATTAIAQQKPVIAAPRAVLPLGVSKTSANQRVGTKPSQPIRYRIPSNYSWLNNWRNLRVATPVKPRIGRAWPYTPVRPATNTGGGATPTSSPRPAANANVRPVVMTPSRGPIGTTMQIRLNRNLGASANLIRLRAVVSRGVPAQLLVRLSGSGNFYSTSAPIQMCIQGGGRWNADLLLTNGQRIDNIGTFTPTNCPR